MSDRKWPIMPDLSHATQGFHHTIDSALDILSRLGISAERVSLRMGGAGLPSHWIVQQSPAPGTPLSPDLEISLLVGGLGLFHALPVGMWDRGGEAEPGTEEIIQVIDDPLQKAAHWIREGARFFDVHPDNLQACARWIRLFGIDPEDWPSETWYPIAALLPNLHRLAGREQGIGFALQLLLNLPLRALRRRRWFRQLDLHQRSLLAQRATRLGVDMIVGDRLEDLAQVMLVIGPVSLQTFYRFRQTEFKRRLASVLSFCVPYHQDYTVIWQVEDVERAPRLGIAQENAVLGINTHMGRGGAGLRASGEQEVVQ